MIKNAKKLSPNKKKRYYSKTLQQNDIIIRKKKKKKKKNVVINLLDSEKLIKEWLKNYKIELLMSYLDHLKEYWQHRELHFKMNLMKNHRFPLYNNPLLKNTNKIFNICMMKKMDLEAVPIIPLQAVKLYNSINYIIFIRLYPC